ncbi:MAG: DUF3307 domain-containing protein [Anaerolineales bacterium]|jgi:hypothetical protein
MNTFTWLLIGHFLGDWALQNDWMAKGKREALLTLAGVVHFAIYTTTIIGALLLSGAHDRQPMFYLTFGAITFVSHWLIDATDGVERWMHFYRQSHLESVRMMVDQVLHLLVLLALVAVFVEA